MPPCRALSILAGLAVLLAGGPDPALAAKKARVKPPESTAPLSQPAPPSAQPAPDGAAPGASAPAAAGQSPAPEPQWSEAEVAAATAECRQLLAPLAVEVTYRPPLRQGACGTPAPVELVAFGRAPRVRIEPPAILNCRMVAALVGWFAETVQPAARAQLGGPVVRLRNATSYACRSRYNAAGEKLSEHAHANALDIGAFQIEGGREIAVVKHWGTSLRELVEEARRKTAAAPQVNQVPAGQVPVDQVPVPEPAAPASATGAASQWSASVGARLAVETASQLAAGQGSRPKARKAARSAPAEPLAPAAPEQAAATPAAAKIQPAATGKRPKGAGAAKRALAEEARRLGVARPPPADSEGRFLVAVHEGACGRFATVLGPEANDAHKDHFHVDLQPRKGSAYCQ